MNLTLYSARSNFIYRKYDKNKTHYIKPHNRVFDKTAFFYTKANILFGSQYMPIYIIKARKQKKKLFLKYSSIITIND